MLCERCFGFDRKTTRYDPALSGSVISLILILGTTGCTSLTVLANGGADIEGRSSELLPRSTRSYTYSGTRAIMVEVNGPCTFAGVVIREHPIFTFTIIPWLIGEVIVAPVVDTLLLPITLSLNATTIFEAPSKPPRKPIRPDQGLIDSQTPATTESQ